MINSDNGRPSGEAVVKLLNKQDLEEALKCERRTLDNRRVILEKTDWLFGLETNSVSQ